MKKLLLFCVGIFVVVIAIVSIGDDDSDQKEEADAEPQEEKAADQEEKFADDNKEEKEEKSDDESEEDDYVLDDDEVDEIKQVLEDDLDGENDEDYGDFNFFLDKFKYDGEENTIRARIAVEDDPLPMKQEVIDYTQDEAWFAGATVIDKDFNVSVMSTLKFDDDEYTPLGTATFKNGETSFSEQDGLEVLDN